jgi:hypothetical protein
MLGADVDCWSVAVGWAALAAIVRANVIAAAVSRCFIIILLQFVGKERHVWCRGHHTKCNSGICLMRVRDEKS